MPVKLRLRKQGRKGAVHYAIVAADSRAPRDGRYIEKVGYVDPIAQPAQSYIDHELALKWLGVGAQPTHTVRSILRHAGITLKFALIKQGKSEEEIERIFGKWWEEKKARKKKKYIQIDIHGKPLEEIPLVERPEHKMKPQIAEEEETAPETEEATETTVEATAETTEETTAETTEETTAETTEETTAETTEDNTAVDAKDPATAEADKEKKSDENADATQAEANSEEEDKDEKKETPEASEKA